MLAKQQTNVPVLLSLPMKYLTQTTYEGWQRPTGVIAARCSVPWHRKHTTYFTLSLLFLLWQPSWLCVPTKINSCTNRANKYNWSSLVWIHSVLKLVWSLLSTFWPHTWTFFIYRFLRFPCQPYDLMLPFCLCIPPSALVESLARCLQLWFRSCFCCSLIASEYQWKPWERPIFKILFAEIGVLIKWF